MRLIFLSLVVLVISGCGETRVQYRKMPGFYGRMANIDGAEGGAAASAATSERPDSGCAGSLT